MDADKDIGCLVLTGSTKAFAAGADISEMKDRTFDYAYQTVRYHSFIDSCSYTWERFVVLIFL